MTRRAVYISIIIATAVLAVGLVRQAYPIPAFCAAILGLAWISACFGKRDWAASPAFASLVFISAAAILGGVPFWMSFVCVIFSLAAWDLTLFSHLLEMTGDPSDRRSMERTHFMQFGIAGAVSLLGVLAARFIHVNLTFGLSVILALLGVWGISTLVYRLRRQEDEVDG